MTTKKAAKKRPAKRANRRTSTAIGKRAASGNLKFLKSAHTAVRSHLAATSDLPTFLASAGNLTLKARKQLVEQALVLIDDNFVHLPLKEAMHGVDPVQKLRLIRHRLNRATPGTMDSEYEFHRQMLDVFTSVRDLHTNYLLPMPFADKIAFMPFEVEEYFDQKTPHYIATHFVQGFSHPTFKPGVEIVTWNGVPAARAVDMSANVHAGSNTAARHARGLEGLTIRGLRSALPPDEMWVVIGYVDLQGNAREIRQDWLVTPMLPDSGAVNTGAASLNAACQGIDIAADNVRRAKKMLFAPKVVAEARKPKKVSKTQASAGQSLVSVLPDVFKAGNVTTPSGDFGYIRIFTFNVSDPEAFIDEFVRLAGLLPKAGLIVDVRANGGGHIHASEGLLQTLTPRTIDPEPAQFINTPLNGRICERHEENPAGIDLGPWAASIRDAVETGAVYSRGYPITPYAFANKKGQKYHGPVVLITDARCYSATDIFAAGFKDHEIGHILGVDDNTGAGGANVWTHDLLKELLRLPAPADPASPYSSLPNGAGMRVAIRRTLRVGLQSGTPLEDLGVQPDFRHVLTKDDLLQGNRDLINHAGEILKKMPVRILDITTAQTGSTLTITATTGGIDRIDTYVNERPIESRNVSDGTTIYSISLPTGAGHLRLAGFKKGASVAARKIDL